MVTAVRKISIKYLDLIKKLIKLKHNCMVFTLDAQVHSSPLTCIAAHLDNNLLLTGSEDCTACLISIQNKKVGKQHTICIQIFKGVFIISLFTVFCHPQNLIYDYQITSCYGKTVDFIP